MRTFWVTCLAFIGGVFTTSLNQQSPQYQQDTTHDTQLDKRQYEDPAAVLDILLVNIKFQTAYIDSTLAQYPEPLDSLQQDVLSTLIGPYFAYIALLIQDANELLKAINQTSWLQQKTQDSCGSDCISQKTNDVINEVGHATKTSVLKLGLKTLGKYIHPVFLALSGAVLTLNTIVGGTLLLISGLVNGIFLAIAAGIAYLGHLVSERERHEMGGPTGPNTHEIAQLLDLLNRMVTHAL